MRLSVLLGICITLLTASCAGDASTGDWPMPRRDIALTGRSSAKGNITSPQIVDRIFTGAYEGLAVVNLDKESHVFSIPGECELNPSYPADHANEWNTGGVLQSTIDEDRLLEPDSTGTRYAKLLPDVPGLQKMEFGDIYFGVPTRGSLYAFDQGKDKPRLVWQTDVEKEHVQGPNILVTDTDADGLPEMAVSTHYRVMIYNGQTGVKKTELLYHYMRNYGFFGCFTIPGERFPKFLVIGNFASHIEVLDNDGKNLQVLWKRDIEPSVTIKQTITRPGPNPIADVDGDGMPEIVINLFNYTEDNKWHVTAFDALTGAIRYDLPDTYLRGLADVDDDGVSDLLLQDTTGCSVPEHGSISLVSMKGGKQNILWSHRTARWQTTNLTHHPLTMCTSYGSGSQTVLIGDGAQGKELYVITPACDRNSHETLMVVGRDEKNRWKPRATITGPPGATLNVKAIPRQAGKPGFLLSWRSSEAEPQSFKAKGAQGEIVSWRRVPCPVSPVIVKRLKQKEQPTLIVQNGHEEIAAYQKSQDGWHTRWNQPGWGMTADASNFFGVVADDVDGDGEAEVLFARRGKTGEAELAVSDADGKLKWTHTFTGIDGAIPVWNSGGITNWTVGRFAHRERSDVFVNVRRSTMHTSEGFCLDGKDGQIIWWQDKVYPTGKRDLSNIRAYGGFPMAIADIDGDGFDDLINAYPDCYWVASGRDGNIQYIESTAGGIFPDRWVAYSTPIIDHFWGQAQGRQVLLGACTYITALLTVDGEPLWYGPAGDGPSVLQGCGSTDSSDRIFIGGVYKDGFRCYEPKEGKVVWTYPLPESGAGGPTITADVNSDGLDEFLFTKGEMLYALNGRDGKANLVWSLELPANPGPLVYADADGDGKPEILFVGSDSYLYIAGEK